MLKAATALALLAGPALSDEVWRTDGGEVVYLADRDGQAVLSFPYEGGVAHLYVEDLAGNTQARGEHPAYWVAPDADGEPGPCRDTFPAEGGGDTWTWGVATLVFDRAAFPTGFEARLSLCDSDQAWTMRADLP